MNVEAMVQGLQGSLPGIFKCSETPSGSVRVRTLLTSLYQGAGPAFIQTGAASTAPLHTQGETKWHGRSTR